VRGNSQREVAARSDHNLDRLPLIHRAAAVRHIIETNDPVEDAPALNHSFHNVRQ